ncbi:MAG: mechanosensitive ion channel family protein [Pikeienuella sp.]
MEWIVANVLNILYAGGILIVGFLAAGWLRRVIIEKALAYEQLDDTLFTFLGSMVRYGVIGFTLIIVLARFGIETTSFIAVLGAAGLAIGLALQGTLSNVAAGVMLMVFRPFKLGQFIDVAGHAGTVKEITLFTTELATGDNVQIIIPNSAIWSGSIVNYSHHETRRVDMVFGVSYGSNLKDAEKVLMGLIDDDPRVHHDPAPFCKVTTLGDSSVDFTLRLWCDAGDYWALKFDFTRAAKDALDEAGIDIPFPTTTVVKG